MATPTTQAAPTRQRARRSTAGWRKPDALRRHQQVHFPVSYALMQAIDDAARRAGTSRSEYLRRHLEAVLLPGHAGAASRRAAAAAWRAAQERSERPTDP